MMSSLQTKENEASFKKQERGKDVYETLPTPPFAMSLYPSHMPINKIMTVQMI
jgi:hypothetical protein